MKKHKYQIFLVLRITNKLYTWYSRYMTCVRECIMRHGNLHFFLIVVNLSNYQHITQLLQHKRGEKNCTCWSTSKNEHHCRIGRNCVWELPSYLYGQTCMHQVCNCILWRILIKHYLKLWRMNCSSNKRFNVPKSSVMTHVFCRTQK